MENYSFTKLDDDYKLGEKIGEGAQANVYLVKHPTEPTYALKIDKVDDFKDNIKKTCKFLNGVLALIAEDDLPLLPKSLNGKNPKPYYHLVTDVKEKKTYLGCSMGYAPDLRFAIKKKIIENVDACDLCLQITKLYEKYKAKGILFFDAHIFNYGWFNGHVVFLDLSDFISAKKEDRMLSRQKANAPQKFTLYRQQFLPEPSLKSADGRLMLPTPDTVHEYSDAKHAAVENRIAEDLYFNLVAFTPVMVTIVEVLFFCVQALDSKMNEYKQKDPDYNFKVSSTLKDAIDLAYLKLTWNTFKPTSEGKKQIEKGGERISALFSCVMYCLFVLMLSPEKVEAPLVYDPIVNDLFPKPQTASELWHFLRNYVAKSITTEYKGIDKEYFNQGQPEAYLDLANKFRAGKLAFRESELVPQLFFAGFSDRTILK